MAIAYKCKTVQPIPKQTIFFCPKEWCKRAFTKKFNCLLHVKACTQKMYRTKTCNICKKVLSKNTNLARHMLTHKNRMEYKCIKCKKCFLSKDVFDTHVSRCGNSSSVINNLDKGNLDSEILVNQVKLDSQFTSVSPNKVVGGSSCDALRSDDNVSLRIVKTKGTVEIPTASKLDSPVTDVKGEIDYNDLLPSNDITTSEVDNNPLSLVDQLSRLTDSVSSHPDFLGIDAPAAADISSPVIADKDCNEPKQYPVSNQDSKTCHLCNKTFTRRTNLRRHLLIHTKRQEFTASDYQMQNSPMKPFDNTGLSPGLLSNDIVNHCIQPPAGNLTATDNITIPCNDEVLSSNVPSHSSFVSTVSCPSDGVINSGISNDAHLTSSNVRVQSRTCRICNKTFTGNCDLHAHMIMHMNSRQGVFPEYPHNLATEELMVQAVVPGIDMPDGDGYTVYSDNINNSSDVMNGDNSLSNRLNSSDENVPVDSNSIDERDEELSLCSRNQPVAAISLEKDPNSPVVDPTNYSCTEDDNCLLDKQLNTFSTDGENKDISKTCQICEKTFTRRRNLRKHMLIHMRNEGHKFQEHGKTQLMKNPADVQFSNSQNISESSIGDHGNANNSSNTFIANSGIKSFYGNVASMVVNSLAHSHETKVSGFPSATSTPDSFNMSISNPNSLTEPVSDNMTKTVKGNGEVNDESKTCQICRKIFTRRRNLRRHMEIHTRQQESKSKLLDHFPKGGAFDSPASIYSYSLHNNSFNNFSDMVDDNTSDNLTTVACVVPSYSSTCGIAPSHSSSLLTMEMTPRLQTSSVVDNHDTSSLEAPTSLNGGIDDDDNITVVYPSDYDGPHRSTATDSHVDSIVEDINSFPVTLSYFNSSVTPSAAISNPFPDHMISSNTSMLHNSSVYEPTISSPGGITKYTHSNQVSEIPMIIQHNNFPKKKVKMCYICKKTFTRNTNLRKHLTTQKCKPVYNLNDEEKSPGENMLDGDPSKGPANNNDSNNMPTMLSNSTDKMSSLSDHDTTFNGFDYNEDFDAMAADINDNVSLTLINTIMPVVIPSDYAEPESMTTKSADKTDDIKTSDNDDGSEMPQQNNVTFDITEPQSVTGTNITSLPSSMMNDSAVQASYSAKVEEIKGSQCHDKSEESRTCHVCKKIFSRAYNLRRHLVTHSQNYVLNKYLNSWRTKDIGDAYHYDNIPTNTTDKVSPTSVSACTAKPFFSIPNISNHITTNSNGSAKTPFVYKNNIARRICYICNKIFTRTTTLKRHMDIHKSKPYKCKKCPRSYRTKEEFDLHFARYHPALNVGDVGSSPPIATSNKSSSNDVKQSGLENILSKDTANLPVVSKIKTSCVTDVSLSQSSFPSTNISPTMSSANIDVSILDDAKGKTGNDRPKLSTKTCHICKKTFTRTTTLRRHLVIHKTKPYFRCDKCQNSFFGKERFDRHVVKCNYVTNASMVNTSSSGLSVDINLNKCNNSVISNSDSETQISKAMDVPFVCSGVSPGIAKANLFPSNSAHVEQSLPLTSAEGMANPCPVKLEENKPTVSGFGKKKLSRTCHICYRTFTRTTTLRRHMNVHKKKTNYKCDKCQQCYQGHNTFVAHVAKCHSVNEISESMDDHDSYNIPSVNDDTCNDTVSNQSSYSTPLSEADKMPMLDDHHATTFSETHHENTFYDNRSDYSNCIENTTDFQNLPLPNNVPVLNDVKLDSFNSDEPANGSNTCSDNQPQLRDTANKTFIKIEVDNEMLSEEVHQENSTYDNKINNYNRIENKTDFQNLLLPNNVPVLNDVKLDRFNSDEPANGNNTCSDYQPQRRDTANKTFIKIETDNKTSSEHVQDISVFSDINDSSHTYEDLFQSNCMKINTTPIPADIDPQIRKESWSRKKASRTCNVCFKTFTRSTTLRRHMQIHDRDKTNYKCEKCKNIFRGKEKFDSHLIDCVCRDMKKPSGYEYQLPAVMNDHHFPFETNVFPPPAEFPLDSGDPLDIYRTSSSLPYLVHPSDNVTNSVNPLPSMEYSNENYECSEIHTNAALIINSDLTNHVPLDNDAMKSFDTYMKTMLPRRRFSS